MFFLNLIIGIACALVGAICGIKDCKESYGIAKGVRPLDGEFRLYADDDEELPDGLYDF